MRRVILAVLFVVSLVSMLCIGFVAGALFTPLAFRAVNVAQRVFTGDRPDFNIQPRDPGNLPQFEKPGFSQPGAPIVRVLPGSPADQAGITGGEFIVSIDGESIRSGDELARALARHEPGDSVTLEVLSRDGDQREVTIELGEHPEQRGRPWLGIQYGAQPRGPDVEPLPSLPDENLPQMPDLPPDEFPFVPGMEHPGALISEVLPDSPAQEAGLKPGQLIQSVDGKEITASNTLVEAIAAHEPGDTVTLTVYEFGANAEPSEVEVTLGENPDRAGVAWLGVRFMVIDIDAQPQTGPEG